MLCKPSIFSLPIRQNRRQISGVLPASSGQEDLLFSPPRRCTGWVGTPPTPMLPAESMPPRGRPSDNPLIIHVASPQDAAMYADTDALYDRLAKAFMPGPLTVIMPRKPIIPLSTTGGLETVAVRCPSHPVAHALIAAAGVPIAAPSANLSGKPSPRSRSAGYGRARGHDPGWRRLRDRIGIHHR